ncbi:MAG TPA: glycosyltransferase family 4 protein [Thermopolyspora sp.]|jgi:Glycosyltransferase
MRIRYLLMHAFGMGGTIRTVINQANAMARLGHQVELVSAVRRRDSPQFPLDPRVAVVSLVDQRGQIPKEQRRTLRHRVLARLRPGIVPRGEYASSWFTWRVESAVVQYVSKLTDGILVTTRPALNILAAHAAPKGVILVAQEHMNLASHRDDVRAAIVRLYPRFHAVVVLTNTDRSDYEKVLPGTRIVRIPNSVHSLDQRHTRHTGKTVIAAGRLVAQKGFDLLIPAFERVVAAHPDWKLRIYGTGPKKTELRALIEDYELGKNISLMGRTDHFDDRLAKASMFVLSSRFEGLPMVMIEAMSHALPVVSFDCPTGPADVITDGVDGVLVPPEDVEALGAAMIRLIDDKELRRRLGEAAVTTVKKYASGVIMPRWEALFADLPGPVSFPDSIGSQD